MKISSAYPFTWVRCCLCKEEVKLERVYVVTVKWHEKTIGSYHIICEKGALHKHFFCRECCESKQDVIELVKNGMEI